MGNRFWVSLTEGQSFTGGPKNHKLKAGKPVLMSAEDAEYFKNQGTRFAIFPERVDASGNTVQPGALRPRSREETRRDRLAGQRDRVLPSTERTPAPEVTRPAPISPPVVRPDEVQIEDPPDEELDALRNDDDGNDWDADDAEASGGPPDAPPVDKVPEVPAPTREITAPPVRPEKAAKIDPEKKIDPENDARVLRFAKLDVSDSEIKPEQLFRIAAALGATTDLDVKKKRLNVDDREKLTSAIVKKQTEILAALPPKE